MMMLRHEMRTLELVTCLIILTMTISLARDVTGYQHMTSYPRGPCESPACHCVYEKAKCICDNIVQSIALTGQQSSYIQQLSIQNCKHVHIAENTIRNLTMLRKLEISNVEDLILSPMSMHGGHWHKNLEIKISNSTIENLSSYVFQGNLSEIRMENNNIKQISAFAFSSITSPHCRISFSNNRVQQINQQAFKRIQLLSFKFESDEFIDTIPSKILSEVEVFEDFSIIGCKFGVIKSSGINVVSPTKVQIRDSYFAVLEGDALMISARGKIEFRNNTIGELHNRAFGGLSISDFVLRNFGKQDLIFDDNTIVSYKNGGFWMNLTSLNSRFSEVKMNEKCTCEVINKILVPRSAVHCSIIDPHHPKVPPNNHMLKYENAQKIYELECREFGTAPWYVWLLTTFGILVFLLIIGGLVIWWCKRHRSNNQKEWINNGDGKKFSNPNMVMPEPKTYRETELHVIVERAELLTTDL